MNRGYKIIIPICVFFLLSMSFTPANSSDSNILTQKPSKEFSDVASSVTIIEATEEQVFGEMIITNNGSKGAFPNVTVYRSFKQEIINEAKEMGIEEGSAYFFERPGEWRFLRKVDLSKSNNEIAAEFGVNTNSKKEVATPKTVTKLDTGLYWATYNSNFELVFELIMQGADVNYTTTEEGFTPLMLASGAGQTEIVALLLKSKADVNAVAKNGVTALFQAVCSGHTEIVKLLLEAKADVNAKINLRGNDFSVLSIAKIYNNKEIIALLESMGLYSK